jgi:spore coat protein A, manganese oxidase
MSKKSRQHRQTNASLSGLKLNDETSNSSTPLTSNSNQTGMFSSLKRHWLIVAVIAFVALGTLGAGLKYLDDDARRELAKRSASTPLSPVKDESMLNAVNPFLPASLPSPTPQLSKEYIYAGSRLLAVEDANATAAPPADLAIWRPSSGVWWVMGGQGSQQTGFAWGTTGDTPVPGDYDGDGKTDFSVFRPGNNTWYIFNSSTNALTAITFGQAGDKVAQADYDGDGRTDAAVFRDTGANLGTWYVQGSSSGFYASQFGLSSDAPAPADYDGDGKADIAVWRNSNKTFYSNNSSNNNLRTSSAFAQTTTETPVSADYDGDGRADHAIRNSNNWLILKSSTNTFDTIPWQQSSDKAVPNDYDGDGKVDIAVWKSNGNWYIRQSSHIGQSNELRQATWGTTGDIPVPAFYRR